MMNKKVGRPTDSLKDKFIKLRVDKDTLKNLDDFSNDENISKSQIIRNAITNISSKDFEEMISLKSLKRLEKFSIECEKTFNKSNKKIKSEDVSKNFPAFVLLNESKLCIKYPTYKIRILNENISNDYIEYLNKILKNIENLSEIYLARCGLCQNNINKLKITYLPEVICLNSKLSDNESLKDKVIERLNDNNILYEVWPEYYLKYKDIKIEKINNENYIV